jgi:hypothetical protein
MPAEIQDHWHLWNHLHSGLLAHCTNLCDISRHPVHSNSTLSHEYWLSDYVFVPRLVIERTRCYHSLSHPRGPRTRTAADSDI